MSEVTRILSAIEQGDSHAAEQLLPAVYEELRRLAAQKLAQEKPGQTLQATALVLLLESGLIDGRRRRRVQRVAKLLVAQPTGREVAVLEDPNLDLASITFTPDGTKLIALNAHNGPRLGLAAHAPTAEGNGPGLAVAGVCSGCGERPRPAVQSRRPLTLLTTWRSSPACGNVRPPRMSPAAGRRL